ncbi:MAG: autotransporter domain-containing protein [Betaproteobacteria bacterium]
MQKFKRALLAAAIGIAVSAPALAQFDGVTFFGDSLTDAGSYKPVLPPGTGLFTTNPGPVWATVFGGYYGFAVSPANQGGNDYAQGGARVSGLPGVPNSPPTGTAVPVTTQVTQFLAKGPLNPNAIYTVWAGANDIFYQLGLLQAGVITSAQLQANLVTAATELVTQVARLRAAGAQYIFVFNLPDIGKTPFGTGSGQAAQITALSGLFNTALATGLNATGIPTIRFNALTLLNEIIASPATYGFANSTATACGATPSLLCTPANLVTPQAAQTYVFADGVHPTTGAHALIAQAVNSMITGPQQIAALGEAPFAVEEANFRAIDSRMWSSLNAPRTPGKLQAWAAYDYGSIDMSAGPNNGTGNINSVVVGGDIRISDHILAGGSFGYSENKGDFGGPGGGFKLRQPVGTVYAGYGDGPWYAGVTLGAGSLDFSNVNRNIPLGAAIRNENGQTRGNEYTGRLIGGYWFKWQDVLHGPYARVAYTKATIREFAENGSDSTALIYGEQKTEQLLWSAGWQVAGNIGNVRPFARATWQYDSLDKDRTVNASSVTLGGWYSIPVSKPDNDYVLFNLGASADFGGVTGYIMGSATAARGDTNYYAITVGIRAPL